VPNTFSPLRLVWLPTEGRKTREDGSFIFYTFLSVRKVSKEAVAVGKSGE